LDPWATGQLSARRQVVVDAQRSCAVGKGGRYDTRTPVDGPAGHAALAALERGRRWAPWRGGPTAPNRPKPLRRRAVSWPT